MPALKCGCSLCSRGVDYLPVNSCSMIKPKVRTTAASLSSPGGGNLVPFRGKNPDSWGIKSLSRRMLEAVISCKAKHSCKAAMSGELLLCALAKLVMMVDLNSVSCCVRVWNVCVKSAMCVVMLTIFANSSQYQQQSTGALVSLRKGHGSSKICL